MQQAKFITKMHEFLMYTQMIIPDQDLVILHTSLPFMVFCLV